MFSENDYKMALKSIKKMALSYQYKDVSKDTIIIQIVSMCDFFLKHNKMFGNNQGVWIDENN